MTTIRHLAEFYLVGTRYVVLADDGRYLLVAHPAHDRPRRAVLTIRGDRIWKLMPLGPGSLSPDYEYAPTDFTLADLVPVGMET